MADPTSRNAAWIHRDLAVLWHPCTQMHDHAVGPDGTRTIPLLPIASAQGAWLTDMDGRRYLDAVSSWWTCLFGHRDPRLVAALQAQLDALDHVLLAGFGHAPAIELAEELLRVTPPGLAKVFYADNGSAAVEIALKLAFHYHRNRGATRRTRFVALSGGYHGETLGALAVTDVPLYRETYAPLLLQPLLAPSPDAYLAAPGEDAEHCALRAAQGLRELLAAHGDTVCALILEPLVQCAGGMRMHHPRYLSEARKACDEHGVLLIADEIAVGFGRTGTLFACEQPGVSPDLMLLSKGLTGGMLPLAAVLATQRIYDAFYAEHVTRKAFLHSHSYTGNPLACAVARAVLRTFAGEPILEHNRATAARMRDLAAPLTAHPHVAQVRQTGMIVAIETVADARTRRSFPALERRGLRAYRHALARGVLLRPLGDVLYWMPPYCVGEDELALLATVTAEAVDAACAD
ncbi:MAG: adenosylmethionine--8-amino-7-oxononanoate transaminase [Proteobacteria bacterium]|nr:adenosylmethionine--8-amino-7-oxononanoate transaminase [Pseudomonadota bacterium]MBS0463532.1 adenosylmethionine--8-amino-7-oxononanoate transaminase [Pseudomonadota bacterium]